MRFLADENISSVTVGVLRQLGYDVNWVGEDSPGAPDTAVVARARREGRIILTFDKDFGDLAFQAGLPSAAGVVLFRFEVRSPEQEARIVRSVLAARDDWEGHFAAVDRHRIRMRPLPVPRDPASE